MNMKHLLIYTFLITATQIHAEFYQTKDAYVFAMPWPTHHEVKQNGWQLFQAATLQLPKLLQLAQREKKQVILALPDCYERTKTTEFNAPIVEGARVALTWASVYHRFFNVDARIILTKKETTLSDLSLIVPTLFKYQFPHAD